MKNVSLTLSSLCFLLLIQSSPLWAKNENDPVVQRLYAIPVYTKPIVAEPIAALPQPFDLAAVTPLPTDKEEPPIPAGKAAQVKAYAAATASKLDELFACFGPAPQAKKNWRPTQLNLAGIYGEEPEWKLDAARRGQPLSDGILGPVTRYWLQRFCEDMTTQYPRSIVTLLDAKIQRLAEFGLEYPLEKSILISQDFKAWSLSAIGNPPTQKFKFLETLSDQELLNIVELYLNRKKPRQETSVPEPQSPDTLYGFAVTREKFQQLNLPDLTKIDLIGKTFSDADKAETEIKQAVQSLFKDRSEKIHQQAVLALKNHLDVSLSYQLNDKTLNAKPECGLSAAQIVAFNGMKQDVSTNKDEFAAKISNVLNGTAPQAEEGFCNLFKLDKFAETQMVMLRIVNDSEIKTWSLNQAGLDKADKDFRKAIKATPAPASLMAAIASIQNIEYPNADALHTAVQIRLMRLINSCRPDRTSAINFNVQPIDAAEKKSWREELKALSNDAELAAAIDKILPDNGNPAQEPRVCDSDYRAKLQKVYDALFKPAVEQFYLNIYSPAPRQNIVWDGGGCGCGPQKNQGLVYALYPFWTNDGKPLPIDFKTVSRIGYYGLSFDEFGKIYQAKTAEDAIDFVDDTSPAANAFINVAHDHGSKVDWVIEKNWQTGQSAVDLDKLETQLDRLSSEIDKLLRSPLTDLFSRAKPLLSLGVSPTPNRGDGVTLYFRNYPSGTAARNAFNRFFRGLREKLNRTSGELAYFDNAKPGFYINLVVAQKDFTDAENVFGAKNLSQLEITQLDQQGSKTPIATQESAQSVILLLINEPNFISLLDTEAMTSHGFRYLILPTLGLDDQGFRHVDGNSRNQAEDIRQKQFTEMFDNFGGVGFWRLPSPQKAGAKAFNDQIANQFTAGYPQTWWDQYLCVYRWLLIAGLNIWLCLALVLAGLLLYFLPIRCCRLPGKWEFLKNPAVCGGFALPPLLFWIYLLIWADDLPYVSLTALLALMLVALIVWATLKYVAALKHPKPFPKALKNRPQPPR